MISSLAVKQLSKIVYVRQRIRMLLAQRLLSQLQRPPVHRLCLLVLALPVQHQRQITHAHQRIRMLLAQRLLSPLCYVYKITLCLLISSITK